MAEEYTIGDVAKFLKKIRRKRHKKQDELGDTNPLSLVFRKSPCCTNNRSFYQNYLSLSKEDIDSTSEEEDDDESAIAGEEQEDESAMASEDESAMASEEQDDESAMASEEEDESAMASEEEDDELAIANEEKDDESAMSSEEEDDESAIANDKEEHSDVSHEEENDDLEEEEEEVKNEDVSTKPGRTKPESTKPERTKPEREEHRDVSHEEENDDLEEEEEEEVKDEDVSTKPERTKPERTKSESTKPERTKPERKVAEDKVQSKPKKKKKKQQPLIPRDKRTIFVGNIPTQVQKRALRKYFLEYGLVETVRMRSLAPAQQGMPQKVVGKTQDINSKRNSYNAYLVFTTVEAAHKALEKNGKSFNGHHLRVDLTDTDEKDHQQDSKRSVFLGSLPYSVNEEDVRRHFEDFGELETVRVVRDATTGMGKGFGFLVFKDPASVALTLKMKSQKLKGRRIRIKPMDNKQKQNERPISGNAQEEKKLSNAERRINQKSLKRIRYKKKIKNRPQEAGPLDKFSKKRPNHKSVSHQNHPAQKQSSKQNRRREKANPGKSFGKNKRQHGGAKSQTDN